MHIKTKSCMLSLLVLIVLITSCTHETISIPEQPFKYTGYECNDTLYHNGQILYPDYVHLDTLIVTDAKLLNELIPDMESDGDISDALSTTTRPINSH